MDIAQTAAHITDDAPLARTVDGTARALGVGRTTTYELIKRRELDARRVAGRTLITEESIRALLARAPRIDE